MEEDIKEALELVVHAPSLVEKMHLNQRVLNYLQRTRLPLCSFPSPFSKFDRRHTRDLERETTCWRGEEEGGGGGANHTTSRKSGPL
jgi:hypothetical protein